MVPPIASTTPTIPVTSVTPESVASHPTDSVYITPTVVKKKKNTFRPGFAREDADSRTSSSASYASSPVTPEQALPPTITPTAPPAVPSLLNGLVIHADPETEKPTIPMASQESTATTAIATGFPLGSLAPATAAPVELSATSFGILSGMTIHEDDTVPPAAPPELDPATGAPYRTDRSHSMHMPPPMLDSYDAVPASAYSLASAASVSSVSSGLFSSLNVNAPTSLIPAAPASTATPSLTPPVMPPTMATGFPATATAAAMPPLQQDATASGVPPVVAALEALEDSGRATRMSLADSRIRVRQLQDEEQRILEQIQRDKQNIDAMSKQQDDAIRTEAFDQAEMLAERIESVSKSLRHHEEKRNQVLQQLQEIRNAQNAIFQEATKQTAQAISLISEFHSQKLSELERFRKDVMKTKSETIERILSDAEQLQSKESLVAAEVTLLEEEASNVEKSIKEQTGELSSLVVKLEEQYSTIMDEVEELKRKLAEKEAEAAGVHSELSSTKSRIDSIRSRFEKQHARVALKKERVTIEQNECRAEAEAIAQAKRECAGLLIDKRKRETTMLKIVKSSNSDKSVLKTLDASLKKFSKSRALFANKEAEHDKLLQDLATKVESAMQSLRDNATQRAADEAAAASKKKQIETMDAKIPQLEEEKLAAVAAKKFKEAGRLNDELKRMEAAREEIQRYVLTLTCNWPNSSLCNRVLSFILAFFCILTISHYFCSELSVFTNNMDEADQRVAELEQAVANSKKVYEDSELNFAKERAKLLVAIIDETNEDIANISEPLEPLPIDPVIALVHEESLETLSPSTISPLNPADYSLDYSPSETQLVSQSHGALSKVQKIAVDLLTANRDTTVESLTALIVKWDLDVSIPKASAARARAKSSQVRSGDATPTAASDSAAPVTAVHPVSVDVTDEELHVTEETTLEAAEEVSPEETDELEAETAPPTLPQVDSPDAAPEEGIDVVDSAAFDAVVVEDAEPASEDKPDPTEVLKGLAARLQVLVEERKVGDAAVQAALNREDYDAAAEAQTSVEESIAAIANILGDAAALGVHTEVELLAYAAEGSENAPVEEAELEEAVIAPAIEHEEVSPSDDAEETDIVVEDHASIEVDESAVVEEESGVQQEEKESNVSAGPEECIETSIEVANVDDSESEPGMTPPPVTDVDAGAEGVVSMNKEDDVPPVMPNTVDEEEEVVVPPLVMKEDENEDGLDRETVSDEVVPPAGEALGSSMDSILLPIEASQAEDAAAVPVVSGFSFI